MMRWIKDSVHGDVFISSIAGRLLDTPEMQRLRRVAQTSFANLIYPGANHTRFEHSIGTYYLMSRGCFFNNLEKDEGTKLVIAALLHDVGHSAFSHALEGTMKKHTGKDHEEYTNEKILSGELAKVLESNGIDPQDITAVYEGAKGKAILGYLGTDKMDYLLRDSYYTGMAYGSVDADRILRKIVISDNGIVLEEKGVSAAEAMLMARFLMYPNVYFHPVAKSAEMMIERAAEESIRTGNTKPEELTKLDDAELMVRFLGEGGLTGEYAQRLHNRKLYKVATRKLMRDFNNWLYLGGISENEIHEAEETIAAKASVPAENIMLHIPKPWFGDVGVRVMKGDDYYSLDESSLITRLLKEAQWDYQYVQVFCPEEYKNAVSAVDLSFLEE